MSDDDTRHPHRSRAAEYRRRPGAGGPSGGRGGRDAAQDHGEPWPYVPYTPLPVAGGAGWYPPYPEMFYYGYRGRSEHWLPDDRFSRDPRQHPGGRDGGRDLLDRAYDEVASWFGDDDAEARRAADHRGRGPRDYVRSDERISDDVHDVLTDDPHVDASDVRVTVRDGEVTLDGEVSSRFEKRRAEDCADSVSGVRHTQNNLRIRNASGTSR